MHESRKKLRRSYLWKIDIRILPAFAALFLLSFSKSSGRSVIQRLMKAIQLIAQSKSSRHWRSVIDYVTSIGNAKVLGLQEDLGLSQHEYQIALAV